MPAPTMEPTTIAVRVNRIENFDLMASPSFLLRLWLIECDGLYREQSAGRSKHRTWLRGWPPQPATAVSTNTIS